MSAFFDVRSGSDRTIYDGSDGLSVEFGAVARSQRRETSNVACRMGPGR